MVDLVKFGQTSTDNLNYYQFIGHAKNPSSANFIQSFFKNYRVARK
jgi:hypothetical protein